MNYQAVSKFKVYLLVRNSGMGQDTSFSLVDQRQEFDDESAARIWVQDYGERQTEYTIIEVLRKP